MWTTALSWHVHEMLLKLNVWWSVRGLRFEGRNCRLTLMADAGPVWRRSNRWSSLTRLCTVVKIQWSASSSDRFTAGTHWIGGLRVTFMDTNSVGAFLCQQLVVSGPVSVTLWTTLLFVLCCHVSLATVLTMLTYRLHGAESVLRS